MAVNPAFSGSRILREPLTELIWAFSGHWSTIRLAEPETVLILNFSALPWAFRDPETVVSSAFSAEKPFQRLVPETECALSFSAEQSSRVRVPETVPASRVSAEMDRSRTVPDTAEREKLSPESSLT